MAKQLKKVYESIIQDYGDGSIFDLGAKEKVHTEVIPCKITQLDEILGGGWPLGRICEIFGWEATGKTTLALKLAAAAQVTGNVAYIDTEHCLSLDWAKKLGVNTDELTFSQPDHAEMALDIIERLIKSEQFNVIILDSVAALVPKAELEGEVGDCHVGLASRLMSQAMRRLCSVLLHSKCCLIFINQIRMKIGVMFGNPETTTGGNALKFFAAIRLHLQKTKTVEEGKTPVGLHIKAKTVKNKIVSPFQECSYDIMFTGEIK
jgi:recombination protein RecA